MTANANTAAWLTTPKSYPFEIKEAPTWTPSPTEILIKNHAVAINPVDGSIQSTAWWPLAYPTILGHDVAGEVAAIGSSVTRFKIGDRVLGQAVGMTSKRNEDAAFQKYTLVAENLACYIPDHLGYESAVALPLGVSTAACGLFQEDFLNLQYPSVPAAKPTGQTLLVWGGAGSVGSNAIQLAVAAGYEVLSTASPKNFDLVKSLGASQVFDYASRTVIEDIVTALKSKTLAGAIDCIGPDALEQTVQVVKRASGVKFVATANGGLDDDVVTVKMIIGSSLKHNDVGKAIYEDFLPRALVEQKYVAAPEPLVIGRGLERVQEGVDLYRTGVGARKVVVLV
ncbi:zinc-binding alcohol dehydrogenase family protein [Aspergillus undulatus]|uniref:zinc-binding alcohol dehydrogenase family protein n=1 Tax=Aspergillus undulatus TaxID=1810928 RepID=UPI003CCD9AB6